MSEVWKAVPGYLGYEVSNLGNVRSYRMRGHAPNRLGKKPHPLSPAVEMKARRYFSPTGYKYVLLRKDGESHYRRIHTLVLEAFAGPRPAGYQGAHLNGNALDNRIENLKWCTPKENAGHKKLHGTNVHGKGEELSTSKLTLGEVVEIKKRLNAGERPDNIAPDYPAVSTAAIVAIFRGQSWVHVEPQVTFRPCWIQMTPEQEQEVVRRIKSGETIVGVGTDMGYNFASVSKAFRRVTGVGIRQYKKMTA